MQVWARIVIATGHNPSQLPTLDSLIAAAARHHHLTVVIRNTAAFGVPLFNPFSEETRQAVHPGA